MVTAMQAVVTGLWELAGFKELPGGEWPHPSPGPEPPDAQLRASLPSLPVPRLSSQHLDLLLQALPLLLFLDRKSTRLNSSH